MKQKTRPGPWKKEKYLYEETFNLREERRNSFLWRISQIRKKRRPSNCESLLLLKTMMEKLTKEETKKDALCT